MRFKNTWIVKHGCRHAVASRIRCRKCPSWSINLEHRVHRSWRRSVRRCTRTGWHTSYPRTHDVPRRRDTDRASGPSTASLDRYFCLSNRPNKQQHLQFTGTIHTIYTFVRQYSCHLSSVLCALKTFLKNMYRRAVSLQCIDQFLQDVGSEFGPLRHN